MGKRKEERKFQRSLRERVGMSSSPAVAISESWQETEAALASVQGHLEILGEFAKGDPNLEAAVADALSGIADDFTAIAASLESVEESLITAKLLDPQNAEGFEPDSPAADA